MKILIENLRYDKPIFRTPFKFGSAIINDLIVPEVTMKLVDTNREGIGIGAMTLGNAWSYPGVPYQDSLNAMQKLVERISQSLHQQEFNGSVFSISHKLKEIALAETKNVQQEMSELKLPIPKLCSSVCYSLFDIALFDAWGKMQGGNTYQLLRETNQDIPDLNKVIHSKPIHSISIFHTVGGVDPLVQDEVSRPVNDGLPECLEDWIRKEGLTHFKIKMRGDDPDWDFKRVVDVDKLCSRSVSGEPVYSLDCNEKCPSGKILLELLQQLQKEAPKGFQRILFVEQPTSRDFSGKPEDNVRDAAKLKPVAIDEGLVDMDAYHRARELGYNGIVLKACKGIGFSLQMAAIARQENLFLTVQDLTCPGIAYLASFSLAAWLGVNAVEANARQFCPNSNEKMAKHRPEVFQLINGKVQTDKFTGPGLGMI